MRDFFHLNYCHGGVTFVVCCVYLLSLYALCAAIITVEVHRETDTNKKFFDV